MADKRLAKREVSCWRCTHCNSSRGLHEENQLRFIQQQYKRFRFYWTKKHFISEWYFANYKTMRLGVLWWEKLKNRESQGRIVPWAWTSLGVEEQLLIFSLCLSPGWVKNLQMFINVCLKLTIVLIWTIQSPLEDNLSSCEMYKIITWHEKLWAAKSREAAVIRVTLCFREAIDLVPMNSCVRIMSYTKGIKGSTVFICTMCQ